MMRLLTVCRARGHRRGMFKADICRGAVRAPALRLAINCSQSLLQPLHGTCSPPQCCACTLPAHDGAPAPRRAASFDSLQALYEDGGYYFDVDIQLRMPLDKFVRRGPVPPSRPSTHTRPPLPRPCGDRRHNDTDETPGRDASAAPRRRRRAATGHARA